MSLIKFFNTSATIFDVHLLDGDSKSKDQFLLHGFTSHPNAVTQKGFETGRNYNFIVSMGDASKTKHNVLVLNLDDTFDDGVNQDHVYANPKNSVDLGTTKLVVLGSI